MTPNNPEHYSLVAIGTAGSFTVEILETRSGFRLMSIEADTWSFAFALGEQDVASILTHLRGGGNSSELEVGLFHGAPVKLIRDDEFSDRYFLRASKSGNIVDFLLGADRLVQFTNAMADALDDLKN